MVKALANYTIELEIDPNPNGLPVLFMHFKMNGRIKNSIMLDKEAVEVLSNELQSKLSEM